MINKKTLLIHVGYPKTASSSLQFGLFKFLDDLGHLKLKTWRQKDTREHLDKRLSSLLFNKKKINQNYKILNPTKLNVISDESLTAPLRLRKVNYGPDIIDPLFFPELIKKEFKNHLEEGFKIKILVVLRNQFDLLYSQYVEEYKLVLNKKSNLLFDKNHKVDLKDLEIYDYALYLDKLEESFGRENITIAFFEDLKNDLKNFSYQIATLLNYDEKEVAEILLKYHINKKNKNNKGYITEVSKIQIDYFSEKTKNDIMKQFYISNKRLHRGWCLSLKKLKDYGYIL